MGGPLDPDYLAPLQVKNASTPHVIGTMYISNQI